MNYPLQSYIKTDCLAQWEIWISTLLSLLQADDMDVAQRCGWHWLPLTLKEIPTALSQLLRSTGADWRQKGCLQSYVMILVAARREGLVREEHFEEAEESSLTGLEPRQGIDLEAVRGALVHEDDQLRAEALRFICLTHKVGLTVGVCSLLLPLGERKGERRILRERGRGRGRGRGRDRNRTHTLFDSLLSP